MVLFQILCYIFLHLGGVLFVTYMNCRGLTTFNLMSRDTIYISYQFLHHTSDLKYLFYIFSKKHCIIHCAKQRLTRQYWIIFICNAVWHRDVLTLIDCDAPFMHKRDVRCEHVSAVSSVCVCVCVTEHATGLKWKNKQTINHQKITITLKFRTTRVDTTAQTAVKYNIIHLVQ